MPARRRRHDWPVSCVAAFRLLAKQAAALDNAGIADFCVPTMTAHPADDLLLTAVQRAQPARPRGEVVQWAALQGDWLVGLAFPDRACLALLPAGGTLWGEIPVGQKRYVTLAEQAWFFVAAEDADLGPYQLCQLAEAADGVADLATARLVCLDALQLLGVLMPASVVVAEAAAKAPAEPPQPVSRRGFLRALTGRR